MLGEWGFPRSRLQALLRKDWSILISLAVSTVSDSPSTVSATSIDVPGGFDRDDWASGYCNVEQELNAVSLRPLRGVIPAELQGSHIATVQAGLNAMGNGCITPLMVTA